MIQGLRNNRRRECDGDGSARHSCDDGGRNDGRGSGQNLGCGRAISDGLNGRVGADNNRRDYGRLSSVESSAIGNSHRVRSYGGEGCSFRRSTDNGAKHNIGGGHNVRGRGRNKRGVNVRDCLVVSRPYRLGAGHSNRVRADFRGGRSTDHRNIVSRCLFDSLDCMFVSETLIHCAGCDV